MISSTAATSSPRIDYLTEEREALSDKDELREWDEEYGDELAALQALNDEAKDYAGDWQYGATLVRDSYFRDYAEQMADDIAAIDSDARWPLNHIDWDAAAEELKVDYTSVDFGDVTYWVRS